MAGGVAGGVAGGALHGRRERLCATCMHLLQLGRVERVDAVVTREEGDHERHLVRVRVRVRVRARVRARVRKEATSGTASKQMAGDEEAASRWVGDDEKAVSRWQGEGERR